MNPEQVQLDRSRPSSASIEKLVQEQYGLDSKTCAYLLSDETGTVYSIYPRDGKPLYILHVLGPSRLKIPAEELGFMADVCDHMTQHGVLVPTWIRRQSGPPGGMIQAVEGPRAYYLETYLHAERLPNIPSVFEKWGEELARFHLAGNSFQTKFKRSFECNLRTFVIEPVLAAVKLPVLKDHPKWAMRLAKKALAVAQRIKLFESQCTSDEYGLVHGDHHYGNVMYMKSLDRVCLIDMEFVSRGWRMLDVSNVFFYIVDMKDKEQSELLWKAFIQGYERLRPLKPHELESIPDFAAANHLWTAAFPDRWKPDPDEVNLYFLLLDKLFGAEVGQGVKRKRFVTGLKT